VVDSTLLSTVHYAPLFERLSTFEERFRPRLMRSLNKEPRLGQDENPLEKRTQVSQSTPKVIELKCFEKPPQRAISAAPIGSLKS